MLRNFYFWFFETVLGVHRCSEFTQWERKIKDVTRVCKPGDGNLYLSGKERVDYTEYWQERKCVICGKIQQQELRY